MGPSERSHSSSRSEMKNQILSWVGGLIIRPVIFMRRVLNLLARAYFRPRLASCGRNVRFYPLNSTIDYAFIHLADNVYVGPGAILGRCRIGSDTMLGPNVHIRDGFHRFDVVGRSIQDSGDGDPGEVTVGADVWIGEGTVLLKNGHVGDGAVIGTKSVVTEPIPPYVLAVGSPCRPLRKRFSDSDLAQHLATRGLSPEDARELIERRNLLLGAFAART